jgi:argininosuccinate synthase
MRPQRDRFCLLRIGLFRETCSLKSQIQTKRLISDEFGRLIHEAYFFDPALDDLKSYLISTQRRVSGSVRITPSPYRIESVQVKSDFDLLSAVGATYGEGATSYTGADAAGASRLHGFEQELYWSLGHKLD